MADIQRKTANLLNTDQSTQGDGYVDNALLKDGNIIIDTTAFFVTEYIPVTVGTYYYYNNLFRTTIGYINYYNSNKIHLGNVQQTPVMTQGTYNLTALTIPSGVSYIRMSIDKQSTQNCLYTSQLPSYEPYWQHSLRKLTTATETIQSGDTIYANGQPITTYMLKGNEEHTGTPTPSNPVMPQGTGDRTKNLLKNGAVSTEFRGVQYTVNADKSVTLYGTAGSQISYFVLMGDGAATNSLSDYTTPIFKAGDSLIFSTGTSVSLQARYTDGTYYNNIPNNQVITLAKDVGLIYVQVVNSSINTTVYPMITLSTETDTDYEPYGYKIPISTLQGSAVNYLGSVQSTRQIKKLVLMGGQDEQWSMSDSLFGKRFSMTLTGAKQSDTSTVATICSHLPLGFAGATYSETNTYTITAASVLYISRDGTYTSVADFKAWLATEYANGTPVTLWYAFAPTETGIVNEPLMKIGDYADSISNAAAIPTIDGANTITVDTTVQPSEFTATWTGWHDASVKKYDGTDWQ